LIVSPIDSASGKIQGGSVRKRLGLPLGCVNGIARMRWRQSA
jgi:hypothetical protein